MSWRRDHHSQLFPRKRSVLTQAEVALPQALTGGDRAEQEFSFALFARNRDQAEAAESDDTTRDAAESKSHLTALNPDC